MSGAAVVAIPASVVDRLAKLCGLLGSDHDGERAAAAWQASKLLREHRLTWREVIQAAGQHRAPEQTVRPPDPPPWPPEPSWHYRLRVCRERSWRLSEWELAFIRSLERWRGPPSEKQRRVLLRIFMRVIEQ